jgi:hypothetical protein
MISGPVSPHTRTGLSDLLEQHLERIESGLAVVAWNLELDDGCEVDALARDAAGRPVFLFAVDPQGEPDLVPRLLRAKRWLADGVELLARSPRLAGVDFALPSRLMVVGLGAMPELVDQLAALRADCFEVYRLRRFRVDGELVVAVQALSAAGPGAGEQPFRLPSGVTGPAARTHGARFLELMQRLDPSLQVTGDRYSRSFCFGGAKLAELRLEGGRLAVRLGVDQPGGAALEVGSARDCALAFDAVARLYLELSRSSGSAGDALAPASAKAGAAHRSLLEPLRRSIAEARELSALECSMLAEHDGEDDGY